MILQTYPFANDGNYNLSGTTLSGDIGKLALIPNTGQNFSQPFTSSTGFTYDSAKAEFSGGVVRQKYQIINATFSNLVSVVATGNSLQRSTPGGAWNAGARSVEQFASGDGFIQVTVPALVDATWGFSIADSSQSFTDILFGFLVSSAGLLYKNENGSVIGPIGSYSAGDVFKVSVESGVFKYYQNGTLLGSSLVTPSYPMFFDCSIFETNGIIDNIQLQNTLPYLATKVDLPNFSYTGIGTIQAVESSTITEVGSPRYIVGGKYWNGSAWVTSNGTYSQANSSTDIITNLTSLVVTGATSVPVSVLFTNSTTQSSVDLISVTVTGQKYPLSGYIEPAQAIQAEDLLTYGQTVSVDADTSVRVIVKVDGQLKYWNSTAWVNSDGTEAQSNTATEINDNFDSLISINSSIYIRWLLITTVQTKTPSLIEAVIGYDFGAVATDPQTCIVYGYVKDIGGNGIEGASVKFHLVRTSSSQYVEAAGNILSGADITVLTDANGYFECPLIWTSEYEGDTPGKYRVEIKKGGMKLSKNISSKLEFDVPDSATKELSDLITVA